MIWHTHRVYWHTKDVLTLYFQTQEPVSFLAGQFVQVRVEIEGALQTRSYSLCTLPGDPYPGITVKRVKGGVVSNYILDHWQEISDWEIEGPFGSFCLPPSSVAEPLVLIGGGSGLAPLMIIAGEALRGRKSPVLLLESCHDEESRLFRQEIADLASRFPDRFQHFHFLSDIENMPTGADVIPGRASSLLFRKLIRKAIPDYARAQYFLCGPSGLIDVATAALQTLGIPEINIHTEYFLPPEVEEVMPLPDTARDVLLFHQDTVHLLNVLAGQSILDAALTDHVPIRYSCKQGTCGLCKAQCTEGEVFMKHQFALQPSELKDGWVLLCQAHPLTDNVTIRSEAD